MSLLEMLLLIVVFGAVWLAGTFLLNEVYRRR